jgi:hypothetical protein
MRDALVSNDDAGRVPLMRGQVRSCVACTVTIVATDSISRDGFKQTPGPL